LRNEDMFGDAECEWCLIRGVRKLWQLAYIKWWIWPKMACWNL